MLESGSGTGKVNLSLVYVYLMFDVDNSILTLSQLLLLLDRRRMSCSRYESSVTIALSSVLF